MGLRLKAESLGSEAWRTPVKEPEPQQQKPQQQQQHHQGVRVKRRADFTAAAAAAAEVTGAAEAAPAGGPPACEFKETLSNPGEFQGPLSNPW